MLQTIVNKIKGTVALSFSYQAEDVAALRLLMDANTVNLEVFTLDTLKLFPETVAYHAEVERFFGVPIQKYTPAPSEVAALEKDLGDEWGMRESLEKRHLCCQIRKVDPLAKALRGKSAWVTGLRRAQSVTRAALPLLEYDEQYDLFKINPLYMWSDAELEAFIAQHKLPLHPLYAQGFSSIGCAPCTRAIQPGEDIRAGRWWWENPEHKECGLHVKGVKA